MGATKDQQKALLATCGRYIRKQIEPLQKRISELEEKGIAYQGVFQRSADYKRGDVVTHAGSAWHAVKTTRAEPGVSQDWQLMVKAGRNA